MEGGIPSVPASSVELPGPPSNQLNEENETHASSHTFERFSMKWRFKSWFTPLFLASRFINTMQRKLSRLFRSKLQLRVDATDSEGNSAANSYFSLAILITYIGNCGTYCSRRCLPLVKSNMKNDLGISTISLAWIDTCFAISYAVGQLLLPSYITYIWEFNYNTPLLLTFMGSSLCVLFTGIASRASLLCLVWGLHGIFCAPMLGIFAASLMPVVDAEKRAFVLGIWSSSQYIGSFLAVSLFSFCMKHFEWRSIFYLAALINCLVGVAVYIWNPRSEGILKNKYHSISADNSKDDFEIAVLGEKEDRNIFQRERAGSHRQKIESPTLPLPSKADKEMHSLRPAHDGVMEEEHQLSQRIINSWTDLFYIKDIYYYSLVFICVKLVRYSVINWLPFYLIKVYNVDAILSGRFSFLFDAGGLLGSAIVGIASDTALKGHRRLTIGCCTSVASMLLYVFSCYTTLSTLSLQIFFFVLGATLAGPDGQLSLTVAQDICDKWEIRKDLSVVVNGIVNGCGSMGGVIQSYVTAIISVTFGWSAVFIFDASLLALATIFLLITLVSLPKETMKYKMAQCIIAKR